MHLFLLFVLLIGFIVLVVYLKGKLPEKKFKMVLFYSGVVMAIISVIGVFISYHYSKETKDLYKLALPIIVLIVSAYNYSRIRKMP